MCPREALVCFEKKSNNQCKALIAELRFHDPTAPVDSPDKDVPIVADKLQMTKEIRKYFRKS